MKPCIYPIMCWWLVGFSLPDRRFETYSLILRCLTSSICASLRWLYVFNPCQDAVGYRTARRLISLGYPSVRIGAKNPSDVYSKDLEKGAEIVEFCWNDEATYEPALEDVKIVFVSLPYTANWARNFPAFVRGKRWVLGLMCHKYWFQFLISFVVYSLWDIRGSIFC